MRILKKLPQGRQTIGHGNNPPRDPLARLHKNANKAYEPQKPKKMFGKMLLKFVITE